MIMDSKLTLKLNENIIQQAKQYAKSNNISLSRMIENYLQALTSTNKTTIKTSPLVESLTGVIDLKEEDLQQDYTDFLTKKHS